MDKYTWIVIVATFAITIFLTYVRVKDLLKHKQLVKDVAEKEALVENCKRKGQRVTVYLFIVATLVFGVMAFFTPNPLQSLSYIGVFIMLAISEWINVMTIEIISVFERTVVYATNEYKIKNIRTIAASGRKNMNVAMMDNVYSVVPNDVGTKLLSLQKARKAK